MLKLYYKNKDVQNYYVKEKLDVSKLKYIDEFKSKDDICTFIKDFWNLRGVPIYYFNIYYRDDYIRIDYGSHTNFYYAITIDEEDFECSEAKLSDDELNDLNSNWMRKQIEEAKQQFYCIGNLDVTEVKVTGYDGYGHRVDICLNDEWLIRFKKFIEMETNNV